MERPDFSGLFLLKGAANGRALKRRECIPIYGSTVFQMRAVGRAFRKCRCYRVNQRLTEAADPDGEMRRPWKWTRSGTSPLNALTTDVLALTENGWKGRACPAFFVFAMSKRKGRKRRVTGASSFFVILPRARPECGSRSGCPCGRTADRIFHSASECGRPSGRSRQAANPCPASSGNRRRSGSSRPCR